MPEIIIIAAGLAVVLVVMGTSNHLGLSGSREDGLILDPSYLIEPSQPLTFEPPDQVLLDEASALSCPEESALRSFSNVGISLCVPDGWDIELGTNHAPLLGKVVVILSSGSHISGQTGAPSSRIAHVSMTFEVDVIVRSTGCNVTGKMPAVSGNFEVCFVRIQNIEGGEPQAAIRLLGFKPDALPGMTVEINAFRDEGEETIGLQDQAFRDALAMLVNMKVD